MLNKIKEIMLYLVTPLILLFGWIYSLISENRILKGEIKRNKVKKKFKDRKEKIDAALEKASDNVTDFEQFKRRVRNRTRSKK